MKKFILVNLLAGLCFTSLVGAQETNEITNSSIKKSKSYWSRVKFIGLIQASMHEEDFVDKKKEDDRAGYGEIQIGASLPIYRGLHLGLYYSPLKKSDDSKKETNRDEDIQDANGKDIRLVEREIKYDYEEERAITAQLEFSYNINKTTILTAFAGYSQNKGKVTSDRYDMTDRDNPTIFSKHNRYYLNSTSEFERKSILLGSRVEFTHLNTDFFLTGQYSFSEVNFKSTTRNISTNGESIAFDDSAFYFERYSAGRKLKDNTISLGLGLYF